MDIRVEFQLYRKMLLVLWHRWKNLTRWLLIITCFMCTMSNQIVLWLKKISDFKQVFICETHTFYYSKKVFTYHLNMAHYIVAFISFPQLYGTSEKTFVVYRLFFFSGSGMNVWECSEDNNEMFHIFLLEHNDVWIK